MMITLLFPWIVTLLLPQSSSSPTVIASAPPWTMGWPPPIAAPSVGACATVPAGRGERVTVGVPMESVKVGVHS